MTLLITLFTLTTWAGNSHIERPAYEDIFAPYEDHPASPVVTYGVSSGGHPLKLLKISHDESSNGPSVLITGAIHGNEYLHIADRLGEWLFDRLNLDRHPSLHQFFIRQKGVVYVAPVVNPDGFSRGRRFNQSGRDLNRDFPFRQRRSFRHVETRELVGYLEQEFLAHPPLFTMDYHCCRPAILFPETRRRYGTPEMGSFLSLARQLRRAYGHGLRLGTAYSVLGYRPRNTLTIYFYRRYRTASFTFEGNREIEAERFPTHQRMWNWILGAVAEKHRELSSRPFSQSLSR